MKKMISQFLNDDKRNLLLPEWDLILNKLLNGAVYCSEYKYAHMFSGKSQRFTEDHILREGYHTAVNSLPKDIQSSIKKYTIDPEEKYDQSVYTDIQTAIERMRPLNVELILYRGQTDEYLDSQWWISASTSFQIAIEQFTEVEENCCVIVLKVQPGIKILPVYEFKKNLHSWEQEVVIEGGGKLKFLREDEIGNIKAFIYQYSPATTF